MLHIDASYRLNLPTLKSRVCMSHTKIPIGFPTNKNPAPVFFLKRTDELICWAGAGGMYIYVYIDVFVVYIYI